MAEHKEYVDTVINWIWKEFGSGNDYAFFESIIKNSLRKKYKEVTTT
ncbi:hypothetical protein [Clostridium ganghwense]|uniref:Uncharacterized protein n=1 Tax=Clostridium ganghwense TaxID=312089 RepID=A0ABT4CNR6_9CLOT|nr:hypothetical protein [Clostridium ganghwense]MCY6370705.1 hypothetical protein [Clostridium ganghwense]